MSDAAGRQNKMIKGMDETEWDTTMRHITARKESMASFAARAFRQMRERDAAGPQYVPPSAGSPAEANRGANLGLPVPAPLKIETIGELAAIMHGAAAMATAAGVKLPERQTREALALARMSVGAALGDARPKREQPEALRLANEQRRQAARERRA